MKPLLPVLKEVKRYILFKILSEFTFDKSACSSAITLAATKLIGELGCAKAGITVYEETYNQKKKTGIIRVNSKYVDELKLALGTIKEIKGYPAVFNIIKVSGVIGKLK